MLSAVPRGSQIGPLMFIMYINDLTNHVDSCEISLYPDYSKLFREISSVTDCQLVQKDLHSAYLWCETWHLKCNADNCCIMAFPNKKTGLSLFIYIILSQSLPRVTAVKDLGVTLTANLNFKDHNSHNVSKAFKIMWFYQTRFYNIYRCTSFAILVYISSQKPVGGFCSVIVNP